MIGDLIIYLKKIIKQTFCKHEYKIITRDINRQTFNIYTCGKCGREKVKEL